MLTRSTVRNLICDLTYFTISIIRFVILRVKMVQMWPCLGWPEWLLLPGVGPTQLLIERPLKVHSRCKFAAKFQLIFKQQTCIRALQVEGQEEEQECLVHCSSLIATCKHTTLTAGMENKTNLRGRLLNSMSHCRPTMATH